MRGDSRRDLYAKLLALCGLGMLAGAGALVDYWPVPEPLPRVASRPPEPGLPILPAVAPDTAVALVAAVPVADRPVRGERRRSSRPEPVLPAMNLLPVSASTDAAAIGAADWSSAAPPAPPPAATMAEVPIVAMAAILPVATEMPGLTPAPIPAVELGALHEDGGSGFWSDAFRKTGEVASTSLARTGDAIVKGGSIAGASIVDMFRGLAGAVKRVSPFDP